LTRTFAEELAPHQVLNAVAPGAMATETAKSQSWLAERIKTIPAPRGGAGGHGGDNPVPTSETNAVSWASASSPTAVG
jgi:NAD(P)-dependent dehydrogenase (short-subunit alcohol dehydrogenase family)